MKNLIFLRFRYIFIFIVFCSSSCRNSAQIIDHEVMLRGNGASLSGAQCNMHIIDNDIFIVNRTSKKILHYLISNNNADLKDSFYYGNLWGMALAEQFGSDTASFKRISHVISAQAAICDDNCNFGAHHFTLNVSVSLFGLKDGLASPYFIKKKYYQIKYLPGLYKIKKMMIPDSISTIGGNIINSNDSNFSFCRIFPYQKYLKLNIYPLNDSTIKDKIPDQYGVQLMFGDSTPPVCQSRYLFSSTYPLYKDFITTGTYHYLGGVSSAFSRKILDNKARNIFLPMLLASGATKDGVYLLFKDETSLHVLKLDPVTKEMPNIKVIETARLSNTKSSSIYAIDNHDHLIVFIPETNKFEFINLLN